MRATFPIPQSVPFAQLGLPPQAANLFSPYLFGTKYNGNVTTTLAFRFAKQVQFGAALWSPLYQQTWSVTRRRFFNGVNFHRSRGELLPVEVELKEEGFADGDTARVQRFKNDNEWIEYPINLRLDGIDTPESFTSSKLKRIVEYVYRHLKSVHRISKRDENAAKEIIKARIAYLGKISGLVANGFHRWAVDKDVGIMLAPAYTRTAEIAAMCDTLDIADKYGRFIGRIMAGRENGGEDLLAGFIEAALPAYIARVGEELHAGYQEKMSAHDKLMNKWKKSKPELYQILSAESAPIPSVIFSHDESARLANIWRGMNNTIQSVANDFQTMMVFLGLAPPYQKYRGHKTALDLTAETFALRGVDGHSQGHGLTTDKMYRLIRPSADVNDPDHSPVFVKYAQELSSNGKPFNPPDCKDVFGNNKEAL